MVSFILNVIINYFNLIHFFRIVVDRAVYTMTKMPLMFFEKLKIFIIRSCLNLCSKAMVGTKYYFTCLNRAESRNKCKNNLFYSKTLQVKPEHFGRDQ